MASEQLANAGLVSVKELRKDLRNRKKAISEKDELEWVAFLEKQDKYTLFEHNKSYWVDAVEAARDAEQVANAKKLARARELLVAIILLVFFCFVCLIQRVQIEHTDKIEPTMQRVHHMPLLKRKPLPVPLVPLERLHLWVPLVRVRIMHTLPSPLLLLDAAPVKVPPVATALVVFESRNWQVETQSVEETTRDDANKPSNNDTCKDDVVETQTLSETTWNVLWCGAIVVASVGVNVICAAAAVAVTE